ncbi:MAG: hypothetical protein SYC29_15650 [Planctomycetota bacterium]|nr:hypothetical protein [Planctomycetota bacterium]
MSRKHQLHEALGNSALALAAVIATLLIGGCGGTEPAASEETAVDPRFASADSLIEYYNSICHEVETVDPDAVLELYYAESALQERLLRIERGNIAYARVQHASWQQFGRALTRSEDWVPLGPQPQPVEIESRTDGRATALYFDDDTERRTLHLVDVDGRWWISGYTLEYDPSYQEILAELDRIEAVTPVIERVSLGLIPRIRAGEFASADQAKEEYMRLLREALP